MWKNVEGTKTLYFDTRRSFEEMIHVNGINTISVPFERNREKNRKSNQKITVAERQLICNQRLKKKDQPKRKSKIEGRNMRDVSRERSGHQAIKYLSDKEKTETKLRERSGHQAIKYLSGKVKEETRGNEAAIELSSTRRGCVRESQLVPSRQYS
jgi:hypothetical protein